MIEKDGANYRIKGSITLDNVRAVLAEGLKLFNRDGMTVDLSQLEEVDSAAISLILEWLRAAQHSGCKLGFINLPDNLKSLATLYGVLDLLQPN